MRILDWLALWVRRNSRTRGERRRDRRRRVGIALERLEPRQLPAVFTVRPDVADGQPGSLRDAVVKANQNRQSDVIQLLPGRYTLGAADGDLDLLESGRSIVLQGSGAASTILDAAGVDRLLEVNSGVTVTLRDLTLTGGRATAEGGALFAQSGRVFLDNVVVEGNQSSIGGGGLAVTGSKVTAMDSRIRSNSVVSSVGRDARGGGILNDGSQTLIVESELNQNMAFGGSGAAGANGENAQDPRFHGMPGAMGSTGKQVFGGGIAQSTGSLSLHQTVVAGNVAQAGSGGQGGNGGNGDWVNALNTGLGGQGGNGGHAFGGGISVQGGSLAINESEISRNRAVGGSAGGFGLHGNGMTPLRGQDAASGGTAEGGGVAANGGRLWLLDSQVQSNQAIGGSTGNAGEGTSGYSFNGTSRRGADGGNGGNGGSVRGAGLALTSVSAALIDTDVTSNSASAANGSAGAVGGSSERLGAAGGIGGNGGFAAGAGLASGPVLLLDTDISSNLATPGIRGLGGLSGVNGRDYQDTPRTRSESGVSGAYIEVATASVINQAITVSLTESLQAFVLSRMGDDIVLRDASGNELFRHAAATATRLEIIGTTADDTLVIDRSSEDPVPVGGVMFRGMGQSTGDVLELRGTAVWVIQDVVDSSARRLDVDGSLIEFDQLERVTDRIVADTRMFSFGDNADSVELSAGSQPADGLSQLTWNGQALGEFTNPSLLLSVSAAGGNDVLRAGSVDSTWTASLRLDGGEGDDRVTSDLAVIGARLQGGAGNDLLDSNNASDTLVGGDGLDTLNGRGGADWMLGGGGDDSISGGGGNDLITGDAGNDTLVGNSGSDSLFGGDGDDSMRGSTENDTLDGGAGFDRAVAVADANMVLNDSSLSGEGADVLRDMEAGVLIGGTGANKLDASTFSGPVTMRGGLGNDTLLGGLNADLIQGEEGNDSLLGNDGNDLLTGGFGVDDVSGGAGVNRLVESFDVNMLLTDTSFVGFGTDILQQIQEADLTGGLHSNRLDARAFRGRVTLRGGAGDDTLRGGSTADLLLGEDGNDSLVGNAGDDRLEGGAGTDDYSGGSGTDRLMEFIDGDATLTATQLVRATVEPHVLVEEAELIGGDGPNRLLATAFGGRVTLDGGAGDDSLDGTRSGDVLRGGAGRDSLLGRQGEDSLEGGGDDDELSGGPGNDVLSGGTGNDLLMGQEGRDLARGDGGADLFRGVLTDDTLEGGDGSDRLVFTSNLHVTLNDSSLITDGTTTLTGIELAELSGGPADQRMDASGFSGDTTLTGARGSDTLFGGRGNDLFLAGMPTEDQIDGGRGNNTLRWSQTSPLLDLTDAIAQRVSNVGRFDLTGAGTSSIAIDAFAFTRRAANPNGLILLVDPSDQVQITDTGWRTREAQDGFERLRRGTLDLSITAGATITFTTPAPPAQGTVAAFVADSQPLLNVTMPENQIADFDFDGDPDIAFQSGEVLRNDGAGVFTQIQNVGGYVTLAADFDSDGDIDLLSGHYGNFLWLNDGTGHFTKIDSGITDGTSQQQAADLNQDGFLDLVSVRNYSRYDFDTRRYTDDFRVHIRLNDGTGRFASISQTFSIDDAAAFVTLADVDGDGDVDIVHAYSPIGSEIFLNDGTGTFTESAKKLPVANGTQQLAWADIDGDGDFDAFVANYYGHKTAVLLNAGDGTFTRSPQDLFDIGLPGSDRVTLADVDGDGDWDALVQPNEQSWDSPLPHRILANDGHGQFQDTGVRLGRLGVAGAADFDLDGDIDLLGFEYQASTGRYAGRILWNRGSAQVLAFPDAGGTYTLGRDGNQYVVTNPAGQELIRGSLTTDVLIINGSQADDHLRIDLTQGNPIPELGLRFLAGANHGEGDSLELLGSTVPAANYQASVLNNIQILVDGRPIQTLSVESVRDPLAA